MTAPTAPSPGLGEREAVARTLVDAFEEAVRQEVREARLMCGAGPVPAVDQRKLCRAGLDEHLTTLRTENETLRAALALALRFVDRAAGEGLGFTEGDHGEPATDAADVCCAVANTLGIDLDSDEFCALTNPEHPHGD